MAKKKTAAELKQELRKAEAEFRKLDKLASRACDASDKAYEKIRGIEYKINNLANEE